MEKTMKQPRTILEQIVYGQEITNQNIVTLSEDMAVMHAKLDALLAIFSAPPAMKYDSEPDASGAEKEPTVGSI